MTEEAKFPPRIERLFKPKLPLAYLSPLGYAPEIRRTHNITPLSLFRDQLLRYQESVTDAQQKISVASPEPTPKNFRRTRHHDLLVIAKARKAQRIAGFKQQITEWINTDIESVPHFSKSDPRCTVFVLRLLYLILNSQLAESLAQYGPIVSSCIVRDSRGKSRGYAFVVFEEARNASECVEELCRTGLLLSTSEWTHPACVDIERARLVRNWMPRRLGGGMGGRGYKQKRLFSSASALGRRLAVGNSFHASGYRHSQGSTLDKYVRSKPSDDWSRDMLDGKGLGASRETWPAGTGRYYMENGNSRSNEMNGTRDSRGHNKSSPRIGYGYGKNLLGYERDPESEKGTEKETSVEHDSRETRSERTLREGGRDQNALSKYARYRSDASSSVQRSSLSIRERY